MKLKSNIVRLVAAASIALLFGCQKSERQSAPVAPQATARPESGVLRFAPGAPQLAYLKIEKVAAFPEPLVEPLNARIAYDESRTARVSSPINGRVIRIVAEVGQTVRAGDPLAVIDSPDYAQAVADGARAAADLKQKRQAEQRAKILLDGQVLARKDYEQAQDDLSQSEAENRRAQARLKNLGVTASGEEREFILRAPISGMVSERQVNPGSEVRNDGASSMFVITDPRQLWVLVDLPEREISKVKVGQAVMVEVDAYPNEIFPAKVSIVGEALDPQTRRIQVRCAVEDETRRLKPEMFARVTPVSDKLTSMPRISNSAVVTQGQHSFLFVEQAPGVFQKRRIRLAMQGHEQSWVAEGLSPGENIVTAGALLLDSELTGSE